MVVAYVDTSRSGLCSQVWVRVSCHRCHPASRGVCDLLGVCDLCTTAVAYAIILQTLFLLILVSCTWFRTAERTARIHTGVCASIKLALVLIHPPPVLCIHMHVVCFIQTVRLWYLQVPVQLVAFQPGGVPTNLRFLLHSELEPFTNIT